MQGEREAENEGRTQERKEGKKDGGIERRGFFFLSFWEGFLNI